jgi:hypothetical protein
LRLTAVVLFAGQVIALLFGGSIRAHAAPEPIDGHQTLEVVVVTSVTLPSTLETALVAVLGQADVAVRWSVTDRLNLADLFAAHPDANVIARVWIDLHDPGHAAIYLSDRDSKRYLVRDVALRSGMDDLACETAVTIIEAAVEALRGGSAIGVPRAEALALIVPPPAPSTAPRPVEALPEGSAVGGPRAEAQSLIVPPAPPSSPPRLPEPRPRPSPENRVRAAVGLLYEGVGIGAPVSIAQGPGVSLILASRRGAFRPAAWVSVSGHFPVTAPADPIGATLTTGSVRLLPALETSLGSRVTLRLGIGGGADVIRVEPAFASDAKGTPEPPHFRSVLVARAALGVDARLTDSLWFAAGVACDVDVTDNHYDVLVGGTTPTEVIKPWVAQPSMLLGIAWEFLPLPPRP